MFRFFKKKNKEFEKTSSDVTHKKVRRMTSSEKVLAQRLMMLSGGTENVTKTSGRSVEEVMDIATKHMVDIIREYGPRRASYMLIKGKLVDEIGYDDFDRVKHRIRKLLPTLIKSATPTPPPSPKKDAFRAFDSEKFDMVSKESASTDRMMIQASSRHAKTKDLKGLDQMIVRAREALMSGKISNADFKRIQRYASEKKEETSMNTNFILQVRNPPVYGGARTMNLPCSYDPVTHKLGIVMNDRLVITKCSDWAQAQGFRVGQRIVLANGKKVKAPEEVYWALGAHVNAAPTGRRPPVPPPSSIKMDEGITRSRENGTTRTRPRVNTDQLLGEIREFTARKNTSSQPSITKQDDSVNTNSNVVTSRPRKDTQQLLNEIRSLSTRDDDVPPGLNVRQRRRVSPPKDLHIHDHDDVTHISHHRKFSNMKKHRMSLNMLAAARKNTLNLELKKQQDEVDEILDLLEHACEVRDEVELSRALHDAAQNGNIDMNGLEVDRAKTILMDLKLCRNIRKNADSDLQSPKMRKARALLRDIRNKEKYISNALLEKEETASAPVAAPLISRISQKTHRHSWRDQRVDADSQHQDKSLYRIPSRLSVVTHDDEEDENTFKMKLSQSKSVERSIRHERIGQIEHDRAVLINKHLYRIPSRLSVVSQDSNLSESVPPERLHISSLPTRVTRQVRVSSDDHDMGHAPIEAKHYRLSEEDLDEGGVDVVTNLEEQLLRPERTSRHDRIDLNEHDIGHARIESKHRRLSEDRIEEGIDFVSSKPEQQHPGRRMQFHKRAVLDSKVHVEEAVEREVSLDDLIIHQGLPPPGLSSSSSSRRSKQVRFDTTSNDTRSRVHKPVRRVSALRTHMMNAMLPERSGVAQKKLRSSLIRRKTSPDTRARVEDVSRIEGTSPHLSASKQLSRSEPRTRIASPPGLYVSQYMKRVTATAKAREKSSFQMKSDSYIKSPPVVEASFSQPRKQENVLSMRIDTPSPATSPPIPSTTARKQSPVSALECIERLWIVFSWYSAWHFPGDLDHMADTAVFRFLSDTRLVKQKTTACLSPASRHVTTLGHRSMTIADAQTLVHSLRLGRRRCRRTRQEDENPKESRKRWQRRVRAQHKGAVSNIMFKDFLILLDCISARCPYDVHCCAPCALQARPGDDQDTYSDMSQILFRAARARDDSVLSKQERYRLIQFEYFVKTFVFPLSRKRVGLKPSALCPSLSDDRRNDTDTSNRQMADVVRNALGSKLSRSLKNIFTNFLSFESDWLAVVESGGYRLDLNSLRRTIWGGSSDTTRHAERSLMFWPQFLQMCECFGLEVKCLHVRDIAEAFLSCAKIEFLRAERPENLRMYEFDDDGRAICTKNKELPLWLMVHCLSLDGYFAALLRLTLAFEARQHQGLHWNALLSSNDLAYCAEKEVSKPIGVRLQPLMSYVYLSLFQSRENHQNGGSHWKRLPTQRQALLTRFLQDLRVWLKRFD